MADANSRTCTVYALYAKSDGLTRYVGQTVVVVERRRRQHVTRSGSTSRPTHRDYWIRSVIARGDEVCVRILQCDAAWNESERYWIAKLKADGASLVNHTAGGEGMLDAPPELRDRIRLAVQGLWSCDEYRARMSAVKKDVPWTDAQHEARMMVGPAVRSERARRGRMAISDAKRSAISSIAGRANWEQRRAEGTAQGEHISSAKLNDQKVLEIRRLRAAGNSAAKISEMYGVSRRAVSKIISGETWKHLPLGDTPPINYRGEKVYNAAFTEVDIMDIRRRAQRGEPLVQIARDYGKHRSVIRGIVIGKSWRHLPILAPSVGADSHAGP